RHTHTHTHTHTRTHACTHTCRSTTQTHTYTHTHTHTHTHRHKNVIHTRLLHHASELPLSLLSPPPPPLPPPPHLPSPLHSCLQRDILSIALLFLTVAMPTSPLNRLSGAR